MTDLVKWDDLTKLKQEEILREWVDKINSNPALCGSEFLTVGHGIRVKDKKLQIQLCLKFIVKNKMKPLGKNMKGIPANITIKIDYNGKISNVMIPTDVEEIFSGEEQFDV